MKLRGHFYDNNENQQAQKKFMDPVALKHLLDQQKIVSGIFDKKENISKKQSL